MDGRLKALSMSLLMTVAIVLPWPGALVADPPGTIDVSDVKAEEIPSGTRVVLDGEEYVIGKLLGKGGFSVAYQAVELSTGESCAIKVANSQAMLTVSQETKKQVISGNRFLAELGSRADPGDLLFPLLKQGEPHSLVDSNGAEISDIAIRMELGAGTWDGMKAEFLIQGKAPESRATILAATRNVVGDQLRGMDLYSARNYSNIDLKPANIIMRLIDGPRLTLGAVARRQAVAVHADDSYIEIGADGRAQSGPSTPVFRPAHYAVAHIGHDFARLGFSCFYMLVGKTPAEWMITEVLQENVTPITLLRLQEHHSAEDYSKKVLDHFEKVVDPEALPTAQAKRDYLLIREMLRSSLIRNPAERIPPFASSEIAARFGIRIFEHDGKMRFDVEQEPWTTETKTTLCASI